MEKIEELFDEAYEQGIDVQSDDIPVSGMDAAYLRTDKGELITLRNDGTRAERTCWLAEELGHHYTGGDCHLHYNTPEDWRAEAHARKWAHDRLLTPDAIRTAARNTSDEYELAFVLNVTVKLLREAVDSFMRRGLWGNDPMPEWVTY